MAPSTPIIWSRRALRDADKPHSWISKNSANAATRYLDRIFSATRGLAAHPFRGHPLHEAKLPSDEHPYREIHYRNHRIIYSAAMHRVFILTIIHQRSMFHLGMLNT